MDSVNKTLFIPLYGKALVSKKGIILQDKKAESIWEYQKFPLKRKAKSKWLAYYMGMRAAVFDKWLKEKVENFGDCVVLHLGCGLDSRIKRVKTKHVWYDVDMPTVIATRKRYYRETDHYHMLGADLSKPTFIDKLPKTNRAIVVLEGVGMYLTNDELNNLLGQLNKYFPHLSVLVDCYTPFAVKMTKLKNPIKEVGASKVYGIDSANVLEKADISFVKEHDITPLYLIEQLKGLERSIFKKLYAGKMSKKLYKLYEYRS